jgi:hypothetical protein
MLIIKWVSSLSIQESCEIFAATANSMNVLPPLPQRGTQHSTGASSNAIPAITYLSSFYQLTESYLKFTVVVYRVCSHQLVFILHQNGLEGGWSCKATGCGISKAIICIWMHKRNSWNLRPSYKRIESTQIARCSPLRSRLALRGRTVEI